MGGKESAKTLQWPVAAKKGKINRKNGGKGKWSGWVGGLGGGGAENGGKILGMGGGKNGKREERGERKI